MIEKKGKTEQKQMENNTVEAKYHKIATCLHCKLR